MGTETWLECLLPKPNAKLRIKYTEARRVLVHKEVIVIKRKMSSIHKTHAWRLREGIVDGVEVGGSRQEGFVC